MSKYYGVVHWSMSAAQLERLPLYQVSPLHRDLDGALAEQGKYGGAGRLWDIVEWSEGRGWRRRRPFDPETGECPT